MDLSALRLAQGLWRQHSVARRLQALSSVRSRMASEVERWSELVAACRGVSASEALASEVLPLLDGLQFLERDASKILAPRREAKRTRPHWLIGVELEVTPAPRGVVLILAPGNYPLFLPAIQALQALVAGNAVLLKPQHGCAEPLLELAALLPSDIVRVLPPTLEAGREALASGVDLVVVTGSRETGRAVLRQCAETLTPVVAELSGDDAIVVGPGADLSLVARAASWGVQLNGGHTCVAPRRLIAMSSELARLRPLLPDVRLLEARDEAHLLQLANDSELGLGASVFGEPGWARRIAKQLEVGFVTINDLIAPTADPRLPFGGRKGSGFGVTRGAEGLLQMTAPLAISERTGGPLYHLDPPGPHDEAILTQYTRFAHAPGRSQKAVALGRMLLAIVRERVRRRFRRR